MRRHSFCFTEMMAIALLAVNVVLRAAYAGEEAVMV
jgi:hypothetical protein